MLNKKHKSQQLCYANEVHGIVANGQREAELVSCWCNWQHSAYLWTGVKSGRQMGEVGGKKEL